MRIRSLQHPIFATVVLAFLVGTPVAHAGGPAIDLTRVTSFLSGTGADMVLGWQFTANNADTITHVGVWDLQSDGLGGAHEVGIWNSGQVLLASATVPSGITAPLTDDFRYVAITPVAISAGQTYYIGGLYPTPLTDWVVSGGSATTFNDHPSINWIKEKRKLSSTLVFPSDDAGSFPGAFGPNFLLASDATGTIVVEKQTDPDGAPGSYTFSGDATGVISDDGQIIVSGLSPGSYTSTENDPDPFFELSDISCDDANSTANVATRTANFQVEAGEVVTCTFTNSNKVPLLTFHIGGFPPFEVQTSGVGVATLFDDGMGGHVINDDFGYWTTAGITASNPYTGMYSRQASFSNVTGMMSSGFSTPNPVGPGILCAGGCLGGFEALTGVLRMGTPADWASLPLFPVGGGGSTSAMRPVAGTTFTIEGAPFITGTGTITMVTTTFITIPERGGILGVPLTLVPTTNENPVTVTIGGGVPMTTTQVGFGGTNSLISAMQGGVVSLVSPIRITSSAGRSWPGVVTKRVVFMPEPTMPLLLGSGVAGLLLIGLRRVRR
jgi:hypothetical protein